MDRKKKKPILSIIPAALLIISGLLFILSAYKSSILPGKLLIILLPGAALAALMPLLLLFVPKRGGGAAGRGRKITAGILIIMLSLIFSAGAAAFHTLGSALDSVSGESAPLLSGYGIYVMAEDGAESPEALDNGPVGYLKADEENALKLIPPSAEAPAFATPGELIEALEKGEIQALAADMAYIDIISGSGEFQDLSRRIKCIHSVKLEAGPAYVQEKAEAEEEIPLSPAERPFVIYLSGTDVRYDVDMKSRSDVNILAAVNPETAQILLVNTPRDYYIPNPAGNGERDKLTHLGLYGVDCSAQGLSDLYGIKTDYTARINFSGFERLIDAVGGITLRPEKTDSSYGWQEELELDGEAALRFARDRAFEGGDRVRGRHQMEIIRALAAKLMSGSALKNYRELLESLQGMFKTDMPTEDMADLIKLQLEKMPRWEILSCSADGEGTSNIPWSMPGLYAYCMEPDYATVERASELIKALLAGERLSPEALG